MPDAIDLTQVAPRRNQVVDRAGTARSARLTVALDEVLTEVRLERCVTGRLRDAYPVGERDVEVVLEPAVPSDRRAALLSDMVEAAERLDPACRRMVTATELGALEHLAAAEEAGFRYVLDVDIADGSFSLSVAEPGWVTQVDMDLDHVPGS